MSAFELECAVVQRMLADRALRPTHTFDPAAIDVVSRQFSAVGFVSNFRRAAATKLFDDAVSLRWGKVVARINSAVDVDVVVYVDAGYLSGVECVTFGGESFPMDVQRLELTDLPSR